MADGFEMVSDLSALDKNLKDLAQHSEETSKRIIQSFKRLDTEGIQPLLESVKTLNSKIDSIGSKSSKKNPLDGVSKGAAKAVDDVNKISLVLDKILVGDKSYTNSSLYKLNKDIELTKKNLLYLRDKIDFAREKRKDFGPKSVKRGLISEIEKEIQDERKKLEILKSQRAEVISIAKVAIQKSQEEREIQRGRDAEWKRMSDERVSVKRKEAEEILRIEAETLSKNHSVVERITGENIKTKNRALEHEKKLSGELQELDRIRTEALERQRLLLDRVTGGDMQYKSRSQHQTKEEIERQKEIEREEEKRRKKNEKDFESSVKEEEKILSQSMLRRREIVDRMVGLNIQSKNRALEHDKKAATGAKKSIDSINNSIGVLLERYNNVVSANEVLNSKLRESVQNYKKIESSLGKSSLIIPLESSLERDKKQTEARILALKREIKANEEKSTAIVHSIQAATGAHEHFMKMSSMATLKDETEYKRQQKLLAQQIQAEDEAAKKEIKIKESQEKLKTKITEQEAKKRAAQYKKTNISRLQTYGGALDYSKQATTINRLVKANKYLEEARNRLSKTDADYQKKLSRLNEEIIKNKKEIDLATGKSEKLKKAHRGLMDVTGQLARRLALAFSISQITSYINRMVDVRGEFEMQQRSLQILLKDKEKANQLWDKTLALAIKSPFRVKELVTYTKQLAAYRVEADKLYQTNKMLADVSAGLGVDMNRLILAYGQVKAANYLRGTELRQFSEAGVNILEELAKYYSEIEKRTISVGDVFEMVSNRMVKFTDVEEIFHRITSEGGLFFNMQEEQSKTLKGMIMNLKDSYDIMFNEIGKDNNGIIRGALKLTKHLIDNWRVFLPLIKAAGFAYVSYFGVKSLLGTVRVLGEMQKKLLGVSKITSSIGKATPWLIVISAISALAGYLSTAANEANRLRAALNATEVEYMGLLQESIDSYIRLTKNINDSTKSTKERAAALSNLKSKFSGILPQEMLEEKYIKNISDNYEEATKAMRFYYNEKTRLQKEQKIENIFEEDISNEVSEIQKMYQKAANMTFRSGMLSQDELIRFNASISGVINDIVLKTKQGILEVDDFAENVKNKASEYTGISKDKLGFIFDEKDIKDAISNAYSSIDDGLGDLKNLFIEYRKEMNSVTGLQGESYAESEVAKAVQREQKNVDAFKQIYSDLVNSFTEYSKLIDEEAPSEVLDKKLKEIDIENNETFKSMPDRFKDSIRGMFNDMKVSADKGSYELKLTMKSIYAKYFEDFVNNLQLLIPNKADIVRVAKQVIHKISQAFKGEAKESKNSELTEILDDAFKAAVEATGGDLDIFSDIFSSANIEEALHSLESAWKRLRGLLSRFDNAVAAGTSKTDAARNIGLKFKDEAEALKQIAQMRKNLLALNFANKRLGGEDFDKKGSTKEESAALKRLKDQIKTLKDAYKEYTELRNHFDKEYSDAQMRDSFAERFEKMLLGDVDDYDFSSKSGLLNSLEKLRANATNIKGGLVELLKEISKTQSEIDIEADKNLTKQNIKQIEDMFGDYEISLELDKLDIPHDLAKRLFGVSSMSLEELKTNVKGFEHQFDGKEDYEKYQEFLKKIEDMEDKEHLERLKKYSKYLIKAQSESIRIKIEELKQLKEVERAFEGKPDDLKKKAQEGVKREAQQKLDSQRWTEFKDSSMYEYLFTDMENLGSETIELLYKKINELKESMKDLPQDQYKDLVKEIQKIEDIKIDDSPLKSFFEYRKKIKEIGRSQEELEWDFSDSDKKQEYLKTRLHYTELVLSAREQGVQLSKEEFDEANKYVGVEEAKTKDLEEYAESLRKSIEEEKKRNKKAKEGLDSYKKMGKSIEVVKDKVAAWGKAFDNVLGGIDNLLDSLGVAEDDSNRLWINNIRQIGQMVIQVMILSAAMVSLGIASKSAMGVIGWIAMALEGVAMLLSTIFGNKDKSKERAIQREIKKVNYLKEAYEDLNRVIEKGLSYDQYGKNAERIQNLVERINSTRRMIAQEEDKKHSDREKIKGWQSEISDMENSIEDLLDDLRQELVGDFKDYGQKLSDSLISAFKDGKDAAIEWGNTVDEIIQGILKKMLAQKIIEPAVKPLVEQLYSSLMPKTSNVENMFQEIKKMQDSVEKTTLDAFKYMVSNPFKRPEDYKELEQKKAELQKMEEEFNKLVELSKGEMPTFDEDAILNFKDKMNDILGPTKDFFELISDFFVPDKAGELAGLQDSIQGITESTAQILEAYLNSIRLYVADTNTKFNQYLENRDDTDSENPMLSQLKIVAKQTSAIRDLLDSVVKSAPGMGGPGIKVFMA